MADLAQVTLANLKTGKTGIDQIPSLVFSWGGPESFGGSSGCSSAGAPAGGGAAGPPASGAVREIGPQSAVFLIMALFCKPDHTCQRSPYALQG
eukprot:2873273-Pyramimonas_sp.AAC.1